MIIDDKIINWLLDSDPSIKWQVEKDLLNKPKSIYSKTRKQIETSGWGKQLLSLQDLEGTWSKSLYSPKWISTTYTLLQLRGFGLNPNHKNAQKGCKILLDKGLYTDGGINYWKSWNSGEVCVTSMILALLCYFKIKDERIHRLVEYLLTNQMNDGGWNCEIINGATHSSFHTTISALEGLYEYGLHYKDFEDEISKTRLEAVEFLLKHELYKSHKTKEVFDPKMLRFTYPPRWKYDILRCLDFFRLANIEFDFRMKDAFKQIISKQKNEGWWLCTSPHSGKQHFILEKGGKPSRWITLIALRIIHFFQNNLSD